VLNIGYYIGILSGRIFRLDGGDGARDDIYDGAVVEAGEENEKENEDGKNSIDNRRNFCTVSNRLGGNKTKLQWQLDDGSRTQLWSSA
jgi:hypothetical protein